ncbi:MAG TPA: hypothetical protein ENK28_12055 [Aliiroseovarius sp.]|nr:hypothetical protein [Aliiroseovarius sp.]
MSGKTSYLAGLAAEDAIARAYTQKGGTIAAKRWRGSRGEIDLVVRDADGLVFIEVKKSQNFARAAERLSERQMARIYGAASEFLAQEPAGQNTPVRFDVALVDATGQLEIIENAFGM